MFDDRSDWRMQPWFYDEHRRFSLNDEGGAWNQPVRASILEFRKLIDGNPAERAVQSFLEIHRNLFLSFMRTGHGNWLFPQLRFGPHFIADFVLCEGSSGGPHWSLWELESPRAELHLKNGEFSKPLRTAITQIKDWRRYIQLNREPLSRSKAEGGYGLHHIRPKSNAKIVIGRRQKAYPSRFQALRQELYEEDRIEIITHDTLIDRVEQRWVDYYVNVRGQQAL